MFGVFVVLIVLMQLIFQTLPSFVTQRTLFEARERQSKTYAWQTFVLSNMFVELMWHMVSVAEYPPSLPHLSHYIPPFPLFVPFIQY